MLAMQPHHLTLTRVHFYPATTAYRFDRVFSQFAYVDFLVVQEMDDKRWGNRSRNAEHLCLPSDMRPEGSAAAAGCRAACRGGRH